MSLFNAIKEACSSVSYNCSLLWELIYPRRCAVCKNEIDTGYFCEACRRNFVLNKTVENFESLDKAILLYKYQQQLQEAIHNVKFNGEKALLPLLKEEVELALNTDLQKLIAACDIITCVPTSPKRKAERGFDVPQELFAFLDKSKWQPDLLKRVRNTIPLFDLEPELRRQEVAGCFEVQSVVAGKSILLCDDIFTTGSTMNEAAKALRLAGAKRGVALAFTASKDNW